MLLVFKHVTPKSIHEDSTVIKSKDNDSARKRRPHRKSRKGCDICRTRHLKCDEERPECGQCLHGRRSCAYSISPQTNMPTNATKSMPGGSPDEYMSALRNELSSTSYHRGLDPLELIDHFFLTTDHLWMGSAQCQSLLQQHTPRLAQGSSFLLHAMLASSAYHIASLHPQQWGHGIVAAQHYSLALQSYRQAINDDSVDANALFACCMLLTHLSFKHLSDDVYDDDNSEGQKSLALNTIGIRFMCGPRILADAFARRSMLDQGIWKPLIRHCEEYPITNDDVLAGFPLAAQSMSGLEAVCRGEEIGGPFDTALETLRMLMQCYVSDRQRMVELVFCFAIKLDPLFLRFVDERVPKALLVMCYWYALVVQVDQWWACLTAQIEGGRLLRHLRSTADSSIQALLDLPADLLNARSSTTQTSMDF